MTERKHDKSKMTFGIHKGKNLGEIPDSYWVWFVEQPWAQQHPDLVAYARCCDALAEDQKLDERH